MKLSIVYTPPANPFLIGILSLLSLIPGALAGCVAGSIILMIWELIVYKLLWFVFTGDTLPSDTSFVYLRYFGMLGTVLTPTILFFSNFLTIEKVKE